MATVYKLLLSPNDFFREVQDRVDLAEERRRERHIAAMLMIRWARGDLIRRHLRFLSNKATIIQCAYKVHVARKAARIALKIAVHNKHARYYANAAKRIQSLWRGHYSRGTQFCYRKYRHWLATVKERGERRAAEAAEFGIRSRADDLRILEEEARQWLAFVVFKLHHLLRTYMRAGVYSEPATTELSEFEKLLKSIRYTEYMRRLKRKYDEFVKKHKPGFSNKRLFPIIGYGADYWYLSLAEMYELSLPMHKREDDRHRATHHGQIHKEPFLWKKPRPSLPLLVGRGPFTPPRSPTPTIPPTPAPTPIGGGDIRKKPIPKDKDPRFHLYVKYYTPKPELFDYVNFHINVLLRRKCSIENIDKEVSC